MWKLSLLMIIIIGIACESKMEKENASLIESEKPIKAALDIIATRRIADTSKLVPIAVSYSKVMPLINEGDTIGGMKIEETMRVKFFRKKGEEMDADSLLTIWELIEVYLDNNNDTSKATVSIGPVMTTGGKGYTIKN